MRESPVNLTLRMQCDLIFERNSSKLTRQGIEKMREISEIMRQYPDSSVIIKGYTSSEGDDEYNLRLSESRAKMVSNQLVANRVHPGRIIALGMGESEPIANNDTESGRMQNRRVEIDIVPSEDIV